MTDTLHGAIKQLTTCSVQCIKNAAQAHLILFLYQDRKLV